MAQTTICQDRISELPEEILCQILVFLPIRDVIQTTLLSKTWNNFWISIPKVTLHQFEFEDKFKEFVDGFLSRYNPSRIEKFRLKTSRYYWHCDDPYDDDFILYNSRWINKLAMRLDNIVELDLHIFSDSNDSYMSRSKLNLEIKFPLRFFKCKTLVALKVNSDCIDFSPPPSSSDSDCFPSLKSLYYVLHSCRGASQLEMIIPACHVLEDLTIKSFGFEEFTLHILGAELKKIKIVKRWHKHRLVINSPKLERLFLSRSDLSNLQFSNNIGGESKMVKAVIHPDHADRHTNSSSREFLHDFNASSNLLEQVSDVEYLCLSACMFSVTSLPHCFSRLKRLRVRLFLCTYWQYVMELLKRSPNLEEIVLDINPSTWMASRRHEWGREDEDYYDALVPFDPPEGIPSCVSNHLKSISILNFMGSDHEFDVVKYMLKHGKVLKRLSISTSKGYLKSCCAMMPEKLQKKALKLQKKLSKTCEIDLIISQSRQSKKCLCEGDITQV